MKNNKFSFLIYIYILLLFLISPIITFPIIILLYFFDKKKSGILYSVLIGLTLGFIVYHFIPYQGYDLIKHHNIVLLLKNKSLTEIIDLSKKLDLEFIPILYSYIISFFNNVNLLQFFIVSLGYSLILYLLYDYRNISNINNLYFLSIVLFTIFGFNTLYFISGLYCYIGIILFFYSFYLDYVKNKSKKIVFLLYIISLFIHSSLLLPFILLIFFKLLNEKFNLKILFLCILIFVFSYNILVFINSIYATVFLERIIYMFNVYINNDDHYKMYYSGSIYYIEISKLIITLLFSYLCNKIDNKNKKIYSYIFTLSISCILMMFMTRVAIRYIMLIQFIGIIPLMNVFKLKRKKVLYHLIITIFALLYIVYFVNVFKNQNFGDFFTNNIFDSLFSIFH